MSWSCIALTILCAFLIIVVTPCLCCKINGKILVSQDTAIALLVLIPFLFGIICLLTWKIVKVFTKDDALRQIERHL